MHLNRTVLTIVECEKVRAIAHLVETVLKVKRSSFAVEFAVKDFQLKKYPIVSIVGEQASLCRGRESPFDERKIG